MNGASESPDQRSPPSLIRPACYETHPTNRRKPTTRLLTSFDSVLETNELFILDSYKEAIDANIRIPAHIEQELQEREAMSDPMDSLWHQIQGAADECTACQAGGLSEIACPRNSIGVNPPPRNVTCLFVSWNPPRPDSKNFWNDERDNLRGSLLGILGVADIDGFLSKGFFLVHALKCATKQPGELQSGKRLTRVALSLCVPNYLKQEVSLLAPSRICLLGAVAKQAFGLFCDDVRIWDASPKMGESRRIRLGYGEVDCLYTCLPVRTPLIPYATRHISKWLGV